MELVVILVIALIVVGPKRLPEMGKSLGKGMREFRGSINGNSDDDDSPAELERPPRSTADYFAEETKQAA